MAEDEGKKKKPVSMQLVRPKVLQRWDELCQNRPHGTGIVDYGLWVRLFMDHPTPEPPPEGFRRGAIWS